MTTRTQEVEELLARGPVGLPVHWADPKRALARRVLAQFVPFGWGEADRILDFANKTYSTAVGDKDATVWVRVNEAEGLCILTGEYQSEGRNALSTCWLTFPVDAGEGEIADAVARFAEMADEQVGDTYALRWVTPRG